MFDTLTSLETVITDKLVDFAYQPLNILAVGLSSIIGSVLLLWLLYKAYLILAGFSTEPFLDFFREFLIKIFFLTLATTVSNLNVTVLIPLWKTSEALGQELGGGGSKSVFTTLEGHFIEIGTILDSFITDEKPPESAVEEATRKNNGKPVGFVRWAWASIKDKTGMQKVSQALNFDNLWKKFVMFCSVMVMWLGLAIFGIASFISIITNKIFFMICLGFSPIFVFMAAFEKTRSYTMSWLSTTLGYGFSYAVIMSIVSITMGIFKELFASNGISFMIALSNLLVCLILSLIVMRAGDIASAFFGAGNISDGTMGAAAVGMSRIKNLFKSNGKEKNANGKPPRKKPLIIE